METLQPEMEEWMGSKELFGDLNFTGVEDSSFWNFLTEVFNMKGYPYCSNMGTTTFMLQIPRLEF